MILQDICLRQGRKQNRESRKTVKSRMKRMLQEGMKSRHPEKIRPEKMQVGKQIKRKKIRTRKKSVHIWVN